MAHFVVNVTSRYVIIVMDRVRISVGNRVRVWFMVRFWVFGFLRISTKYELCSLCNIAVMLSGITKLHVSRTNLLSKASK